MNRTVIRHRPAYDRQLIDDLLATARAERARLSPHRGAVIWLTGLSAAGKSTLARGLKNRLDAAGYGSLLLDGDVLRAGLCRDLGFSAEDRKENMRRAAEVAQIVAEAGMLAIVALISPFRVDRLRAADRCREHGIPFAEVYVNASLSECERRDPKLLYRRARAGEIDSFTGITSPYEPPFAPALELRTDRETVEQSLSRLMPLTVSLIAEAAPSALSHQTNAPILRVEPRRETSSYLAR